MSNIQHRQQGEDAAHPDATKENATAGNRGAADRANQTDQHSTVEQSRETERERGVYLPLAWAQLGRESKPQKFKGKAKRQARADAIRAKRHQGGIGLFDALAYVALGAWLAAVAVWLVEVLV
jgi:hypothetical protein